MQLRTLLFVMGLGLELVGFGLANSEQIPPFDALVHSDARAARAGLDLFVKKRALHPGEEGFEQICRLSNQILSDPSITPTTVLYFFRGAGQVMTPDGSYEPVTLVRASGSSRDVPLAELRTAVGEMRTRSSFWAGIIIFAIGVAVQIVSFRMKSSNSGAG